MIDQATLTTYGEAAVALGVSPNTIGDLAKFLQIRPKPVRHNGNAKGLDPDDLQRIRKALGFDS